MAKFTSQIVPSSVRIGSVPSPFGNGMPDAGQVSNKPSHCWVFDRNSGARTSRHVQRQYEILAQSAKIFTCDVE